jgi:leucyl-tRNA synthetase
LFSRQRYWGEPFPVIHWEDGEVTLVEDEDLPLELPELEKYTPGESGESPLVECMTDWLMVTDKNGQKRPPRNQYNAAVGRFVLVLPALHRPDER